MKSDFPDLLKRLNDCEVEYVLVGGMAANLHGSPITTMDCDIVVSLDSENLAKLAQALSPLSPKFRHKTPPQYFDETIAARGGWRNIYLDTSAGVLDCLGDIKGLGDFAECRSRSMEVDLGGFSIRILTREALIAAKKAMGRPKDLLTVAQLEIGGELEGK
jgi:hypothetical protein